MMTTRSSEIRSLRSGELAKLCGLSPDSIRHYERHGLLPKAVRSSGNYRLFPPQTVDRVRAIQAALRIGFTLEELRGIFAERDRGAAPCRRVRSLAGEKLDGLDAKIRELRALRAHLARVLTAWDANLKDLPTGKRAGLLDGLATMDGAHPIAAR